MSTTDIKAWQDDAEPYLSLTADENRQVTARWEEARAAHKRLDEVMDGLYRELAAANGARLEGKQFRIKGLLAFRRKAAAELDEGVPLEKVLRKVNDLNRYTLTFHPEHYTEGVRRTYALLHDQGFVIVPGFERNSWEDPVYKGFHASWQQPDGTSKFEIQFHTPAGYAAKTENHLLYDLYRSRHLRRSLAGEENTGRRHEEAAKIVQSERYGRGQEKENT